MFSTLSYLSPKVSQSLCCSSSQAQIGMVKAQINRRRHKSGREPLSSVSQHIPAGRDVRGSLWLLLARGHPALPWGAHLEGQRMLEDHSAHQGSALILPSCLPVTVLSLHCLCCSLPLSFPRGLHFLRRSLTAEQIPFHGTRAPRPAVPRPRRAEPPSPVCLLLWNDSHHLSGVESP